MHLDTYAYSAGAQIWGELPDFSQVQGISLVRRFDDVEVYQLTSKPISDKTLIQYQSVSEKPAQIQEQPDIDSKIKFKPAERLIFKIKYMWIIPIGSLELRVKEITSYKGQQVYHLVAQAKTNKFFSLFFKAKASLDSYMDVRNLCTRGYNECVEIRGHSPRKKTIVYDWKEQTMQYRDIKKKISSCPQDAISALYYIRAQRLEIGKQFNFDIEVSKRKSCMEAKVIKRQNIKTADGQINTWVVRAVLKTGKNLDPGGTITFWLSDDESRRPIFITAKTIGGFISFTNP